METLELSQHVNECKTWRENLRAAKDEMSQFNNQLQQQFSTEHNQDVLKQVEHFQNQFYIQEVNIHDLKHAIRQHEMQLQPGGETAPGPAVLQKHEELLSNYESLSHTIEGLRDEFTRFVNKP